MCSAEAAIRFMLHVSGKLNLPSDDFENSCEAKGKFNAVE